jgi:hypothetical protein
MSRRAAVLMAVLSAAPAAAAELSPTVRAQAERLRDEAAAGTGALELARSLTLEAGPRLAGSAGDRRGIEWGLRTLRSLGFANVRAEPVVVPHWERGEAAAEILVPYPQPLAVAALGGSVPTGDRGLEAAVVQADSLAGLAELEPAAVSGKVVFLNGRTERARDAAGYSQTVPQRTRGAIEAAKKGAVAVVIRSVGTDQNRSPHTGTVRYEEGVSRIPAAALAAPDADLLEERLRGGAPVRLRLRLTPRQLPDAQSANVVGEVPGGDRREEIVLLGCHLDSWDLGHGALDDAAGCAIVIEVGRRLLALPRPPRRTVRVVLFANEEFGLSGARAYAAAHAAELARHVIGAEADLGTDRVWQISSRVAPAALPAFAEIAALLAPLGVAAGDNQANGGADFVPLRPARVPVAHLHHDATRYFDYHHSANDTADKLDAAGLDQSVAAYLAFAFAAANTTADFRPAPEWPPATP